MADGPMVTFAATILERDDFLVLPLLNDFAGDCRALDERTAVGQVVAVAMKQNIGENGFVARFTLEQIDIDNVALGDAMLSAACFDNCVSHTERCFGGKAAQIHTDESL